MNKLVIFDLDGTLLDTLDDLTYYINDACKKFGYPTINKKDVRRHVCYASREFLRRCIGESDEKNPIIDKCHDYYNIEYKNSGSPRTRLYSGMKYTLISLKQKGYKLAIFTNKTQEQTDGIFNRYLKDFGFSVVLGQRQGVVPKPDPTEILNLMKEFGTDKNTTYFVGDGDTDVLAGLRAGVKLIAVTYGYRDKDVLASLGAKVFADSPEEILDIIFGDDTNE